MQEGQPVALNPMLDSLDLDSSRSDVLLDPLDPAADGLGGLWAQRRR